MEHGVSCELVVGKAPARKLHLGPAPWKGPPRLGESLGTCARPWLMCLEGKPSPGTLKGVCTVSGRSG